MRYWIAFILIIALVSNVFGKTRQHVHTKKRNVITIYYATEKTVNIKLPEDAIVDIQHRFDLKREVSIEHIENHNQINLTVLEDGLSGRFMVTGASRDSYIFDLVNVSVKESDDAVEVLKSANYVSDQTQVDYSRPLQLMRLMMLGKESRQVKSKVTNGKDKVVKYVKLRRHYRGEPVFENGREVYDVIKMESKKIYSSPESKYVGYVFHVINQSDRDVHFHPWMIQVDGNKGVSTGVNPHFHNVLHKKGSFKVQKHRGVKYKVFTDTVTLYMIADKEVDSDV